MEWSAEFGPPLRILLYLLGQSVFGLVAIVFVVPFLLNISLVTDKKKEKILARNFLLFRTVVVLCFRCWDDETSSWLLWKDSFAQVFTYLDCAFVKSKLMHHHLWMGFTINVSRRFEICDMFHAHLIWQPVTEFVR